MIIDLLNAGVDPEKLFGSLTCALLIGIVIGRISKRG